MQKLLNFAKKNLVNQNKSSGLLNPKRWSIPAKNFATTVHKPRGENKKAYDYQLNQVVNGFKITKIEEIPLYSMKAFILEHEKTKAKYLHLHAPDTNNCFAVLFRTTPSNDKGAPHILEHITLCGSEKYPVRDPFMNMLKRSLNTYMNAWTGADFTCYPFSSQNEKDFKNLMSVYLESVYKPLLNYHDFLQEGWRYDFAKEGDPTSELMVKGIVYNEMKGVMQVPDNLFIENLHKHVFPGNNYQYNSGGLPKDIPNLSYEELKEFYSRFYHPSNSHFYSYGDLDFAEHLQFVNEHLKNYEQIDPKTEVSKAKRLAHPLEIKLKSPPDAVAIEADKQAKFGISFLCNDIVEDKFTSVALHILSYLLMETPSSPLYQALLESGIASGYCPGYGFDMNCKETTFTVGVRNVGHDYTDIVEIEQIINETLNDVVQEGFTEDFIESALHQIEIQAKVPKSDFGINLLQSLIPVMNHGGDLLYTLKINEVLGEVRQKVKKGKFFEGLIEKYLLNNNHKVKLIMTPDRDMMNEETQQEKKRFKEIEKKLTANDKHKILKDNEMLNKRQEEIQDINILPTLELEDIPKEIPRTEFEKRDVNGIPVFYTHQPTNGITYLRIKIDLKDGPQYFKPFLKLFKNFFPKVGTKNMKHNEFGQLLDLYTYNFEVDHISWSLPDNADDFDECIVLSIGCLDKNIERMFDLLTELFTTADFSDYTHMSNLLKIFSSEAANSFVEESLSYAMSYAAGGLRVGAEKTEKLKSSRFICNLASETLKSSFLKMILQEVERHMIGTLGFIFRKDIMSFCVHGNKDVFEQVQRRIEFLVHSLKTNRPKAFNEPTKIILTAQEKMEYDQYPKDTFNQSLFKSYFALPMQVNYVVESFPVPHYNHQDTPKLHILSELISSNVLLREIREKGGAYGGGCQINPNGVLSFYSYRDPHTLQTYEAFEKGIQWGHNGEMSLQDIKEAKLKVFSNVDQIESPIDKGLKYFIKGITDDMRMDYRKRLLAVTKDDLVDVAGRYLLNPLKDGKTSQVIFGSQSNDLESLVSRGWKIERPVEGLSVTEESYEQNKSDDAKFDKSM